MSYEQCFLADVGGWNNIRMQMELVMVFAFATGRTLVLPPDQPMYLLNQGAGHQKQHSFADFFPFSFLSQRMSVITMETFLQREGRTGALHRNTAPFDALFPPENKTVFDLSIRAEKRALWFYLRNATACPPWRSMTEFLVIPAIPGQAHYAATQFSASTQSRLAAFSANRTANYYNTTWQQAKVIHFISQPELDLRLLEHFYTYLFFQDPAADKRFKRFVRDYVHYQDLIFCKAALIIHQLQLESHNGQYSAFHIRRYPNLFRYYLDTQIPR